MPLHSKWDIGTHGEAAIWKVTEDESYFRAQTQLSSGINSDRRRIEHLASRFLLQHLKPDIPLHSLSIDEHRKPYLPGGRYFFSVSHSWPFIAVAVDTSRQMGIDIQTWHPKIENIKNKFLSEYEQSFCQNDPKLLTHAWCAKESVYKWNGKKGVDFIKHLPIRSFSRLEDQLDIKIDFSIPEKPIPVLVHNFGNQDFACSYVVGTE